VVVDVAGIDMDCWEMVIDDHHMYPANSDSARLEHKISYIRI